MAVWVWSHLWYCRFAFLATVPVVLVYWLAYFVILTKGDSPQAGSDEHLNPRPPKPRSLAKSVRSRNYQALPAEGRPEFADDNIMMMMMM